MGNNKNMKILCYAVVTAMTFTSIVGPEKDWSESYLRFWQSLV